MPYKPINYAAIRGNAANIQGQQLNNALLAQRLGQNAMTGGQPQIDPTAQMKNWARLKQLENDPNVSPEDLAFFRAMLVRPNYMDINQVPHRVSPFGEEPLSNYQSERNAMVGMTMADAQASALGKQAGEAGMTIPSLTITGQPPPKQAQQNIPSKADLAAEAERKKLEVQKELKPQVDTATTLAKFDAETVTSAQTQIGTMLTENRKLDEVIRLAETGANTGPLMSRLPSLTAETLALEQLQREMGLDVVGSVTFGALSEGELNLALQKAIPTNLEPKDLIQWAKDKQAANRKLMGYLQEQVRFLRTGGTVDQWLKKSTTPSNPNFSDMSDEDLDEWIRQNGNASAN